VCVRARVCWGEEGGGWLEECQEMREGNAQVFPSPNLFFRLGVLREQHEGPRHGVARGLAARKEEEPDLGRQLLIAERRACKAGPQARVRTQPPPEQKAPCWAGARQLEGRGGGCSGGARTYLCRGRAGVAGGPRWRYPPPRAGPAP
jgi:hypothetical protein